MVYIRFLDVLRQEDVYNFYDACQLHRQYYKGYPKCYHPLTYFRDPEYSWQCPPEMSPVYLSFPPYNVKYKTPTVLAANLGRTSEFPPLPSRTLAPRYNKPPCKVYCR